MSSVTVITIDRKVFASSLGPRLAKMKYSRVPYLQCTCKKLLIFCWPSIVGWPFQKLIHIVPSWGAATWQPSSLCRTSVVTKAEHTFILLWTTKHLWVTLWNVNHYILQSFTTAALHSGMSISWCSDQFKLHPGMLHTSFASANKIVKIQWFPSQ